MAAPETILVGIDFSETSRSLLSQAVRLGRGVGAKVIALHVVEDDVVKMYEDAGSADAQERLVARGRKILEEMVEDAGGADAVEVRVGVGSPFRVIEEVVEEAGVDVVVVSSHDHEKARKLGVVASRCVRRLEANVLVVRDWHSERFSMVGACVDVSGSAARVFDAALQTAIRHGAALELVHLIYPPGRDYYGLMASQSEADARSHTAAVYDKVNARLDRFLGPYGVELEKVEFRRVILESTHFSEEIAGYLRENKFDLAVIGTSGWSTFAGLRFGSNAERLMRDAPCSVLAVKPAPAGSS